MKEKIRVLHLASFNGNIGDNANHYGFYKKIEKINNFCFTFDELEIREFYWKKRFFNDSFVDLVNSYDLLIIGGGNYFELWVEGSPTGTSIAIELELLKKINTPILINALGVDPGQGASSKNIDKFKSFLDLLIARNDFISIRNDGAKKAIAEYVGIEYLQYLNWTPDAGFLVDADEPSEYYKNKSYIAINVAFDMEEIRFAKDLNLLGYTDFLSTFKTFINNFLENYSDYEIIFIPHIFRDYTFITDILAILDDEVRRTRVSVAPLLHGKDAIRDIMSIYSGAKCVLANRFHANVCNIGLEVPTIGLVNYRQIKELYAEMLCDDYVDVTVCDFDNILLSKVNNKLNGSSVRDTRLRDSMNKYYIEHCEKMGEWLESKFK